MCAPLLLQTLFSLSSRSRPLARASPQAQSHKTKLTLTPIPIPIPIPIQIPIATPNQIQSVRQAQFTPLHLACQQGHNQSARLLLMAGAKADLKNSVSMRISQSVFFQLDWPPPKTIINQTSAGAASASKVFFRDAARAAVADGSGALLAPLPAAAAAASLFGRSRAQVELVRMDPRAAPSQFSACNAHVRRNLAKSINRRPTSNQKWKCEVVTRLDSTGTIGLSNERRPFGHSRFRCHSRAHSRRNARGRSICKRGQWIEPSELHDATGACLRARPTSRHRCVDQAPRSSLAATPLADARKNLLVDERSLIPWRL